MFIVFAPRFATESTGTKAWKNRVAHCPCTSSGLKGVIMSRKSKRSESPASITCSPV